MDRQEFNKSWNGNLPEKKPLSMLVVKIQLECSCNRLFFTTLGTTELEGDFTLANRSHMTYALLIGQNILKAGHFLVDPLKKVHP